MGYYFECDCCWRQVPVDGFDVGTLDKNCEDCGADGCDYCIFNGLCDNCAAVKEDELDNDET